MKKLSVILLSLLLIFAMAGCNEDNGKKPNPNTGNEAPVVTGIVFSRDGGTATSIVKDSTINIDYHETITLTASVTNGDTYLWASGTADVVSITNPTALTATIRGEIITGGNTEITFTAKNGALNSTFKFKITAAPRPTDGLYLDVYDEDNERVTEGKQFTMALEGGSLTFTADALEDAIDVSDTVTWTPASSAIVTITPAAGAEVTITPVALGTETITVKVTSDKTGVNYDDKIVTFIIKVEDIIDYTNVLFMWKNTGPGFGATGNSQMTASNHSWVHTGASEFMAQKDGMKVTTLRTFGAGIRTSSDSLTTIKLGTLNPRARLAIGQTLNQSTQDQNVNTDPIPDFGGQIDLYRKTAKLTIDYTDARGTDGYVLRVYIGNNHTGADHSIYGSTSNLATYRIGTPTPEDNWMSISEGAGKIVLDIDTTTDNFTALKTESNLAKTFIALDAQTAASITITGIKLELIPPAEITGVKISGEGVEQGTPNTLTLEVGETVTLTADRIPLNATEGTIAWSSNNAAASVDPASGLVTGAAPGTATITATLSGVSDGPFTDTVLVTVLPGDITVDFDPEAVFNGFPTEEFMLSKGSLATKIITLEIPADWYINGVKQNTEPSTTYTVNTVWPIGVFHNLTVFITVNDELYSKSVTFMVTE